MKTFYFAFLCWLKQYFLSIDIIFKFWIFMELFNIIVQVKEPTYNLIWFEMRIAVNYLGYTSF